MILTESCVLVSACFCVLPFNLLNIPYRTSDHESMVFLDQNWIWYDLGILFNSGVVP